MTLVELLMSNADPQKKMRHVGKPLGATFLGICEWVLGCLGLVILTMP